MEENKKKMCIPLQMLSPAVLPSDSADPEAGAGESRAAVSATCDRGGLEASQRCGAKPLWLGGTGPPEPAGGNFLCDRVNLAA